MTTSCGDFLSKYPNDQSFVNNVDDLRELLLGRGYMPATTGTDIGAWIHVMDDDVTYVASQSRPPSIDFFQWEPYIETRNTWTILYERISIMNAIMGEIDRFTDEAGYAQVKGETLFLRGAYYWWLTNLYAMPYDARTAATAMGVPLKLTPEIEARRFARNTMQECYNQIVTDLTDAIGYLRGVQQTSRYRASEMAARHLLGRVHLYMGNWEQAVRQCDTILLGGGFQLADFTAMPNGSDAIGYNSSETIFTNGAMLVLSSSGDFVVMGNNEFLRSPELVAMYESADRRLNLFFRVLVGNSRIAKKSSNVTNRCSDFFMFRLPEVYLNRAEALAMLGQYPAAIADVQALREQRITSYNETITLTGEALVNFIRDERRRELCFEGHRWFDLRRYAVSSKWPYQKEVRHVYFDAMSPMGNLVLGPFDEDSAFWVLPIPEHEMEINAGVLMPNPARERKEVVPF